MLCIFERSFLNLFHVNSFVSSVISAFCIVDLLLFPNKAPSGRLVGTCRHLTNCQLKRPSPTITQHNVNKRHSEYPFSRRLIISINNYAVVFHKLWNERTRTLCTFRKTGSVTYFSERFFICGPLSWSTLFTSAEAVMQWRWRMGSVVEAKRGPLSSQIAEHFLHTHDLGCAISCDKFSLQLLFPRDTLKITSRLRRA